jgi:hypothetical protein
LPRWIEQSLLDVGFGGQAAFASPGGAADPPIIHEITLLHFRAGSLPAALGHNRRALAYPYARSEAFSATEANRTREANVKGFPHTLRQAIRISPGQTKIFRFPFRLSRFLSLCFPFPKTIAISECVVTQTRCRAGRRR